MKLLFSLFFLFSLILGSHANAQLGSKNIIGECDTCEPTDIAVADFDGDGLADVAVAYYTGVVDFVWLKNLGEEGFDEPQILVESGSRGLQVKSADLDNDGDEDLIISSIFPSKIEYLLNDGLGNFTDPILLTENIPNPSLLELADLNGDGFLDFFSSDSGLDYVEVMYNNNGTGFTAENYPAVKGSRVYKAADLDQDGDLDLIGASSRFVQWLENTGTGFGEREILVAFFESNSFVSALQVYDMDEDGDLDFLMAHNSDRIYSSKNNGSGSYSAPEIEASQISFVTELTLMDIEQDQDLDVFFSSPTSNNNDESALISMENYGDNKLDFPLRNYEGEFHRGLDLYDLDGDGDQEVFSSFRSGEVFYYENHSFSNKLNVRFYEDRNEDGTKQIDEPWIAKNYSFTNPSSFEIIENSNGSFTYTTEEKAYNVFVTEDECQELTEGEVFTQIDFDTIDYVELIYGLKSKNNNSSKFDFDIFSIPSLCDDKLTFQLVVRNESCLANSDTESNFYAQLELILNEKIESASSDAFESLITDEKIVWDLDFANNGLVIINLTLDLVDNADIDEAFPLTLFAEGGIAGTVSVFDTIEYIAEPYCFSNNRDKISSPARGGPNYTLKTEEISYTIRFQNETSTSVNRVEIRDDLSEYLDINSLEVVSSSFPISSLVKQINSNSVRFVMDNISLPSAVEDLEGSYGFIHFKIDSKPVSGNKIVVRNRAHVYIGSEEYNSSFYVINTLVDGFLCEDGINQDGLPIEPLTYEYTVIDSVCVGEEGSLTIELMDGFGSYYIKGVENSGDNFEGTYPPGNYTIDVSDSGNCQDSFEINIVEPVVNIELEIKDTECGNTNDGSIVISIEGNSGPFVSKYNGISFESLLENLVQNEYIIVVDDSWGCDYVNVVNVSGPSNINLYTSTMGVTAPNGMDGVIYIDSIDGGAEPYTIEWENTTISDSINNLAVGTYSLIVTDSLGCVFDFDVEVKLISNISEQENNRIEFFPNPFSDDLYVQCLGANCVLESIGIYTLDGRLVSSLSTSESKIRIPTANFPDNGMYLMEVKSQGVSHWQKVLKQ